MSEADDYAAEAAAAAVEAIEAGVEEAPDAAGPAATGAKRKASRPKRFCRFPGCGKVVKSQGACQKHGAKPKKCKVPDCNRQSQGNFDGMCKRHFNQLNNPKPPPPEEPPLQATGTSVYEDIIPASVAWKIPKKRSGAASSGEQQQQQHPHHHQQMVATGSGAMLDHHGFAAMGVLPQLMGPGAAAAVPAPAAAAGAESPEDAMPIIGHLRKYAHLEAGWHRRQERAARGVPPPAANSTQLDTWERQLVMFELLLLAGQPQANHKDLAHAWGREKGFHTVLCSQICERGGEIGRKRRNDVGRKMSEEQRKTFKKKVQNARAAKKAKTMATEAAMADQHALAAHEAATAAAAAVGGEGDVTAVHSAQELPVDGEGMMEMEHATAELGDHQYHHEIDGMMMGQGEETHHEIDEAAQV